MSQQIQVFEYDGAAIGFDLTSPNMMVDATAMAKIHNTDLGQFLRNETTKRFISECLNPANSQFFHIEKEEDLYVSRQRSGTWMHRILALKFAAWLNPHFELWVYTTIDTLLFGQYRAQQDELAKVVQDEMRRIELEARYAADPEFCELQSLRARTRHYFSAQRTEIKRQLTVLLTNDTTN